MERDFDSPPRHDEMSRVARAIEALSIAAAIGLLTAHLIRFAADGLFVSWRLFAAILAGAVVADFGSGALHWIADTWGSESAPLFGRRLIRPFRVHHVNPRDFLRRDFIDCNGDVALIACAILVIAWLVPQASVFLVAFAATALPTNQVHQWAHRSDPPRLVAWLQRRHVILNRVDHSRHHAKPHTVNYCIATGWCNPVLTAIDFFPALERLIRRATHAEPRREDRAFSDGATE